MENHKVAINVKFIRRIAEKILGRLLLTRTLPSSSGGGLIRVSAKVGGLKYIFKPPKRWDPELLEIAEVLVTPSSHVWDIGANVGLFSKAAAFHAGPLGSVLSIEADFDAAALLNETTRRRSARDAKMVVLPVAIANNDGVINFSIARRARAANAIAGFGSSQTGGVFEVRTLPCMTLDTLLNHFPAPDLLKIDVEGAEMLVLDGAKKMLTSVRPKIYCEVSSDSIDNVCDLLKKYGYDIWDGQEYTKKRLILVSERTANIVAISQK